MMYDELHTRKVYSWASRDMRGHRKTITAVTVTSLSLSLSNSPRALSHGPSLPSPVSR